MSSPAAEMGAGDSALPSEHPHYIPKLLTPAKTHVLSRSSMKVLNLSQLSLIISQGQYSSEGLRLLLKVIQKLRDRFQAEKGPYTAAGLLLF